jgi:phage FluMu protein Com
MPIEIRCSNCESLLRIADEHAGKSARCPQCAAICPIPVSGSSPLQSVGDYASEAFSDRPNPATPQNPFSAPLSSGPNQPMSIGRRLARHRGETILALGIGSYVCCVLLGIAAIIMASKDLRLMNEGIMDPAGRGLTQAGMILSIIHLVLIVMGILLATVMTFLGAL